MKALEFRRNEVRYAAAAASSRLRRGSGASVGPLRLTNRDPLPLPAEDWVRVKTLLAGICGSDLATINGASSRYFEPWVSFPFIVGHEALGVTEDGQRVVLEPVLGHETRGFEPPFQGAGQADGNDYSHLVAGDLAAGIQTGSCRSTGGTWATEFVAHPSQLHPVPDDVADEEALMVEPAACGVHTAFRANIQPDDTVVVIGSGTMGLTTLAAIKHLHPDSHVIVGAKHPEQQNLATKLKADRVVPPWRLSRAVRSATSSFIIGDDLSGGADVVVDAVGSEASINQAIGICRPRGRVVVLGMPGKISIDMAALWHRETELVGSYTYGQETLSDGSRAHSFDVAFELVREANLGQMVSATYPLHDYVKALKFASSAGSLGAVKVCFDFR